MTDPKFSGIAHLALTVRDMERSLDFYCRVLGLTKVFDIDRDGQPWIIYLKVGEGQFLELFYPKEDMPPYSVRSTNNHICLEVEDIFEVEKTLNENGIPITIPPKGGSDGNWQCWCQDPDGNNIEFMVISPVSKQATV